MPSSGAKDPLDAGDPKRKAWEEFRAAFSGPLLMVWLLRDIKSLAPDYIANLESRFEMAFDHAELLDREDPARDGAVPFDDVPYGDYQGQIVWFDRADAEELAEQLFPHGTRATSDQTLWLGLAVVGLHSAFENYARAVGALQDGGHRRGLPQKLDAYFQRRKITYDSQLFTLLADCDATRHIVVHNHGVVDERYLRAVSSPAFELGERRPLEFRIVLDFARALWRTAALLRQEWPVE